MVMRKARVLLVTAAALALIVTGAAFAATRANAPKIGTGVVVINTNLALQNASAAGTGMVLTSSGRILTNNHVIAGATTIRVVVPKTAHTYVARVVGYDVSDDVAVLQLQKASNLKTVSIGSVAALKIGARVAALGNAGGGGRLVSARGRVTGLHKSITVQNDNGTPERLTGLIETNAPLRPGDSGGPLLNSSGKVVGMDTAASSFGVSDAYAIPITTATNIAKQIVAGKASTRVHIGATALLGVQVQGATIVGVVPGGPAESAGLQPGDVITSIDGTPVSEPGDISAIVLAHKPGQVVTVVYTDPSGVSQTASVTLAAGPPQ